MQTDPQQPTLWAESTANLVWHLWRPWDNLHDAATDRSADIDLKSAGSENPIPTRYDWARGAHLCGGDTILWAELSDQRFDDGRL